MASNLSLRHLCDLLLLCQTQVAGMFAIAAAWLAGVVVLHQTQVNQNTELERRRRRAAALRAVLLLMMVDLCNYAQECGKLFVSIYTARTGGKEPNEIDLFTVPALPPAVIDRLFELIEASDEIHARPLTLLALRLQVQKTRAVADQADSHHPKRISHPVGSLERLIDAAEIYARAGEAIEYARSDGKFSAMQTLADDVDHAVWFFDVDHLAKAVAQDRMKLLSEYGEDGSQWPPN